MIEDSPERYYKVIYVRRTYIYRERRTNTAQKNKYSMGIKK